MEERYSPALVSEKIKIALAESTGHTRTFHSLPGTGLREAPTHAHRGTLDRHSCRHFQNSDQTCNNPCVKKWVDKITM